MKVCVFLSLRCCLTVQSLEVQCKEYKHGHHTAGCLATQGAPLPSLSHSDKDPASSLSAYDGRCVLVLAKKERPPAGPRGMGFSVSTPTAVDHSSCYCFLFIFFHPTPTFKEGRALSLAPGTHHLPNRLYLFGSVLARHLVWGQSKWAPPQISWNCAGWALINCLTWAEGWMSLSDKSITFACLRLFTPSPPYKYGGRPYGEGLVKWK